jgi:hypothetical protein
VDKTFRSALYFVVGLSLMACNHSHGQAMLKRLHKQNQKIDASVGFRAGEPMGVDVQIYRGARESCIKSKGLIEVLFAKEGTVLSLGPRYNNAEWRPGGTRVALSYFHEVNHKLFGSYFYYGIGLQGGSRKYQRLATHYTEKFTWGPQLALRGEVPLKTLTITPQYLYCKITFFAEVVYHSEVGRKFSYVMPAGGVRFNFFY